MENKNEAIGGIVSDNNKENPTLTSGTTGFIESMQFNKFYDDGEYKRFIKAIERFVRQSDEYSNYIALVKSNISTMTQDLILSNITDDDADIEFHHYPFTLFDLVDIVINKKLMKSEPLTSFSVSEEVLALHYNHEVGIVPLTKMNHDLAHGGELFISTNQVFGDWKKFMKDYDKYITQEHKDTITELEKLTEEGTVSDIGGLFK